MIASVNLLHRDCNSYHIHFSHVAHVFVLRIIGRPYDLPIKGKIISNADVPGNNDLIAFLQISGCPFDLEGQIAR